jgi:hypothetical protein
MFEIGQWVSCEDGVGQILYVRNQHTDEFHGDSIGKDLKRGEVIKQFLIVKILINHKGALKKGKRIVFNQSKFCKSLTDEQRMSIEEIKESRSKEYYKYITYDEKEDLDYIVTLEYRVNEENKHEIILELNKTCWKLWPCFTFDEFKEEFSKSELDFDFSTQIQGYSVPGEHTKIRLMLYSRLLKIVDNRMVFYYAQAVDETELFN